MWSRARVLAALTLLLGLIMLPHAEIPNQPGNLGSLVETLLPWFGLPAPATGSHGTGKLPGAKPPGRALPKTPSYTG